MTKKTPLIFIITLLLIGVLLACQSNTKRENGATKEFDMKVELNRLRTEQSFEKDFTLNKKGVAFFESQLSGNENVPTEKNSEITSAKFRQWRGEWIMQLFLAGETQLAIDEFEKMYKEVLLETEGKDEQMEKRVNEFLGMAYFRLGEQQNCIQNHNQSSCILPFSQEAFHLEPTGAEKSITYFLDILSSYPDHPIGRWMLNLDFMALGKYPDGVPGEYLIDFGKYETKKSLSRFKEIGSGMGLAVDGNLGGANLEDFNNDGYLDAFTTDFRLDANVRLFINDTQGGFKDFTTQSDLLGIVGGSNSIHADYDNDGDVDIFIPRGGWLGKGGEIPNSLLRNNGNGSFSDVTFEAGMLSYYPSQTACWADFNNDGWLDLFVGNETGSFSSDPSAAQKYPCELFLNNQDGTFREIASSLDLGIFQWVKGVVSEDFDNDGKADLFISNYGTDNLLFFNRSKPSSDSLVFILADQSHGILGMPFSFPVAVLDLNNDGAVDIYVGGYNAASEATITLEYLEKAKFNFRPHIYLNDGMGHFSEVGVSYGLDRTIMAMGLNFGDINNDGFEELYAATGAPFYSSLFPNIMLINEEGNRFLDVTAETGLGHLQKGHGVAFGDIDNDGDQDIYVNVGGFFSGDNFGNLLFENPGNENNWLNLILEGNSSNKSAIGARVDVWYQVAGKQKRIHRRVSTGGSFGASSLQVEMGFGKCDGIDSIQVFWPVSTEKQVYYKPGLNRTYQISEGQNKPTARHKNPILFKTEPSNTHKHHTH